MPVSVLGYTQVLAANSYGHVLPDSAAPPAENVWYSVTVRVSAAGILIAGDLTAGSPAGTPPFQAFEMLPNKDYVFNVEWLNGQEALNIYNSSSGTITVTALLSPLR